MIAHTCDLKPGDFIHTFGDRHLYLNHVEQAKQQLARTPRALPRIILNPEVKDIFLFQYSDFKLIDYNPYPLIKAPIAI